MKNLIITSSVLAIAIALAGAAFSQTEAPIADRVFKDLRNENSGVRIAAFEQLYAAEQGALENNRPVAAKIRKAMVDLLKFEANQPTPADGTSSESKEGYEGGNDEYIPELIDSVITLHDIKTVDLLLHPWVLGTALVTDELATYGDAIVPKMLANYESPLQTNNNYDATINVRFLLMTVMIEMIKTHRVKNSDYINKFESAFIANAQRNGSDYNSSRSLAIRGLQYFTDPEARRWVQGALNDSDYGVRSEGERALKAQSERLNAQ